MNHAARVGEGHTKAHPPKDGQQAVAGVLGARALVARRALLQHVTEAHALDGLHREVALAGRQHADVVDRHDAGVLQAPGDARLHHKAVARELVVTVLVVQDLERDLTLEHAVEREHHAAHAAARDLVLNRVALRPHVRQRAQVGGLGHAPTYAGGHRAHVALEDRAPRHRELDALQDLRSVAGRIDRVDRGGDGDRQQLKIGCARGGRRQTQRVHRHAKPHAVEQRRSGQRRADRQATLAVREPPTAAPQDAVVAGKEGVGELSNTARHIPHPERRLICRARPHRRWARVWRDVRAVVRERRLGPVAPWVETSIRAAGGLLPLELRRESPRQAVALSTPGAVGEGVVCGDPHGGPVPLPDLTLGVSKGRTVHTALGSPHGRPALKTPRRARFGFCGVCVMQGVQEGPPRLERDRIARDDEAGQMHPAQRQRIPKETVVAPLPHHEGPGRHEDRAARHARWHRKLQRERLTRPQEQRNAHDRVHAAQDDEPPPGAEPFEAHRRLSHQLAFVGYPSAAALGDCVQSNPQAGRLGAQLHARRRVEQRRIATGVVLGEAGLEVSPRQAHEVALNVLERVKVQGAEPAPRRLQRG